MARALVLILLVAGAVAAPASAQELTSTETLYLDSWSPTKSLGPTVATDGVLKAGEYYTVTVAGTYTQFPAWSWERRAACGSPEAAPQNPSPGQPSAPAGEDAESTFARPRLESSCLPLPAHNAGFLIGIDERLRDLDPVDGRHEAPRQDHTYTYVFRGRGHVAKFRISDKDATDNTGILTIRVRPSVQSECGDDAECRAVSPATPPPTESDSADLPRADPAATRLLPSQRVCLSRRRFKIHIISPRRKPLASVAVTVAGKSVRVRTIRRKRHKYFVAVVDLRGKPRGRYHVRVVTRARNGDLGRADRRYRTCF